MAKVLGLSNRLHNPVGGTEVEVNNEDERDLTALQIIAEQIKTLKFDEMMEVARWFSAWTAVDEDGNEQEPTIDAPTMAANLSDWADDHL